MCRPLLYNLISQIVDHNIVRTMGDYYDFDDCDQGRNEEEFKLHVEQHIQRVVDVDA